MLPATTQRSSKSSLLDRCEFCLPLLHHILIALPFSILFLSPSVGLCHLRVHYKDNSHSRGIVSKIPSGSLTDKQR